MSQLLISGGQSTEAPTATSILPVNTQELIFFSIDWFDLLAVQGTLRVFSNNTVQKHQLFGTQPSLWSNSHICM